MKCSRIREWISQEMDGQLAPRHVASLQDHLETCRDCREYRSDLQVGMRMLKATEPELPENFDWKLQLGLNRALREAAQEQHPWPQAGGSWRSWLGRASVAAACGLAAVLTVAMVAPIDTMPLRADSTAAVAAGNPTLRLPVATDGQAQDATRRPLESARLASGIPAGFGGGLQRNVSSRTLLEQPMVGDLGEAQMLRIRQLEQDLETMKRRLFGKDRQIHLLKAQLDSLSGHGVDR
jgi:hypothetical protein